MNPHSTIHQEFTNNDDDNHSLKSLCAIPTDLVKNEAYDCNLEIQIDPDSLNQLKAWKVKLCIAKFIEGSDPLEDLTPTVWLASSDFLTQNLISWNKAYEAYFITKSENEVSERFTQSLSFGQAFSVGAGKAEVTGAKSTQQSNRIITISNCSDEDIKAGLSQKIFFNHKDMGSWPITVQTVKDKTKKSTSVNEYVFVTFVPESIESGMPIMKSNSYPAMKVTFGFEKHRKIFYEIEKSMDRPLGRWYIEADDTWGLQQLSNMNIPAKLTGSIMSSYAAYVGKEWTHLKV